MASQKNTSAEKTTPHETPGAESKADNAKTDSPEKETPETSNSNKDIPKTNDEEHDDKSTEPTMTGSRSFADRMGGANANGDDQEMSEMHHKLSSLGAQMSNKQILENEMNEDNGAKLDEEPIEIDMGDDATSDSEVKSQPKYPDLSGRSGSPHKGRSSSPNKSDSRQGPPVPPKGASRSLTNDSNLRRAFREQTGRDDLSPEELEQAANFEREQAKMTSLKAKGRTGTNTMEEEDFASADEGTEETLQERFKASKLESEILRTRVLQLEKELKETQDFVFSMQPRADKLSEAEALGDYNSLWRSVEEWVSSKLGDTIEAMTAGKERVPLGPPAKILLSIVPPPGREAFRYRDTDEYNVTAVIMHCLSNWILDRDFYCNIEKGGMDFLNSIEKAMRNLEPRRDHITCRTWRAETYLAITNRHSFETFREKLRDQVAFDLKHILSIFTPRADDHELERSIMKAIVDPALQLAHKIHLSVDKYSIRWTPYHTATWEQRQTMDLDLSQFECVDLISGRTVKFPLKGKNVTYILDLSPGLVLETAQAQYFAEAKILKKPRILVAVTSAEEGIFNPKLPRPGDPYTLLGWMEEKLASRSRFVF